MSAAGQPSERTPDFIPGWFEARPGNPDPATREAVRIFDDGLFPISFLRTDEFVGFARVGLGVSIGRRGFDMELAVPPGYWIVRDADGKLYNWRDEDFKAKYIRNNGQPWEPPRERYQSSAPPPGFVRGAWVQLTTPFGDHEPGEAGKIERIYQRGGGTLVAVEWRNGDVSNAVDIDRLELPTSTSEIRREITHVPPEAWKGTPPAAGTRRKLILDTLEDFSARLISGAGDKLTGGSCLDAADAIEEALLGASFRHDESSQTLKPPPIHYLLDSAEIPRTAVAPGRGGAQRSLSLSERVELLIREAASRKATIDGLASTVDAQSELLAKGGRDDAWVSEVAYQAAGAATRPLMEDHPGYVFPSERVRDAVAELLKDFGIARACRDCATEQLAEAMERGAEALTDGIERVDVEAGSTKLPEGMPEGLRHSERELWLRGDPDVRVLLDRISRLREDTDTDRLLEQRESARLGEDQFKAQRDAALHLLRWLIGDIIPPDLIRLGEEEQG